MSDEQLAFSVDKLVEYGIVDSGDSLELGIGAMSEAQIGEFFEKMAKAGVIDENIDYKAAYNMDFANSGVSLEVKNELLGQ